MVIGNRPNPPEYLRTSPLFDDEGVCVVPNVIRWRKIQVSADDYLVAQHLRRCAMPAGCGRHR